MVTPCSARSPLAGCLANGLVTFSGGRKLSGKDWATSASENPGRLATINLHSLNKLFGPVPLGNLLEGIDANQKKQRVTFLQ